MDNRTVDQAYNVICEMRVLLDQLILTIKSRNRSNGYQIGLGRKVREPWEHLQYALDQLYWPSAGINDLLMAIKCLAHSGITYEFGPIPWHKIHQKELPGHRPTEGK
jgi:hypothetical protein